MLNPLALYLAGGAALLSVGAAVGWTVRDWRCDAAETARLKTADKAEDAAEGVVDEEARGYETDRAVIAEAGVRERVIVQEIYRDVEVPAACAVDPAAVSVLDDARRRANAAAAGQLGAAVQSGSAVAEPAG